MINTVRMPVKKLTLTFKDGYINDSRGFYMLAVRLARYKKHFIRATFYPEVGDSGRFHFHGIIYYSTTNEVRVRSFIGNWTRYVGHVKVSDPKGTFSKKNKNHLIEWLFYCKKDQFQWNNRRIHLMNYKPFLKEFKEYRKTLCDRCCCPKKGRIIQKSILDWCKHPTA